MRLKKLIDNPEAMFYISIRLDPKTSLDAVANEQGMPNAKIKNIRYYTKGEGNTTKCIFRKLTESQPLITVGFVVKYMSDEGHMKILQVLKYYHTSSDSCPFCTPIFER